MYIRLVMNREDLTTLNYLQYFIQENVLSDNPINMVSEKIKKDLKNALVLVDSIVCIGINLLESDCDIHLEVKDESREKEIENYTEKVFEERIQDVFEESLKEHINVMKRVHLCEKNACTVNMNFHASVFENK